MSRPNEILGYLRHPARSEVGELDQLLELLLGADAVFDALTDTPDAIVYEALLYASSEHRYEIIRSVLRLLGNVEVTTPPHVNLLVASAYVYNYSADPADKAMVIRRHRELATNAADLPATLRDSCLRDILKAYYNMSFHFGWDELVSYYHPKTPESDGTSVPLFFCLTKSYLEQALRWLVYLGGSEPDAVLGVLDSYYASLVNAHPRGPEIAFRFLGELREQADSDQRLNRKVADCLIKAHQCAFEPQQASLSDPLAAGYSQTQLFATELEPQVDEVDNATKLVSDRRSDPNKYFRSPEEVQNLKELHPSLERLEFRSIHNIGTGYSMMTDVFISELTSALGDPERAQNLRSVRDRKPEFTWLLKEIGLDDSLMMALAEETR